ncbi:hypothetical protein [Natronomonas sp. EA1]|uniref:hypothetical protein n=1 Tax=Natronomonas sp. EA1 TaxID=3421655 RepID=UPI003EBCF98F
MIDFYDTLTHIGYIKEILNHTSNQTMENIKYPLLHILASELILISSYNIQSIVYIIPGVYTITYILGMRALAGVIFPNKNVEDISIIAGIVSLPLGIQLFAPWSAAISIIPLVLFIYYLSSSTKRHWAILALLLLASVFIHIILSILVSIIILAFLAGHILIWRTGNIFDINSCRKINTFNMYELIRNDVVVVATVLLFAFPWLFHSYDLQIRANLTVFLSSFLGSGGFSSTPQTGGTTSFLQKNLSLLRKADLSVFGFIQVFWFHRGRFLILYMVPIISALYLFADFSLSKLNSLRDLIDIFNLYLIFATLSVASLISSGPPFSVIGLGRFTPIVYVCSGVSIIYMYINSLSNDKSGWKREVTGLMKIIFVLALISTLIFTMHPSPIREKSNPGGTEMRVEGTTWYFEVGQQNNRFEIYTNTSPISRYEDYYYGKYHNVGVPVLKNGLIPDKFGYQNHTTLSSALNNNGNKTYVLFTERDRVHHKVYGDNETGRSYPKSSRVQLRTDPTVNKLYTNGEVEWWIIY